jgi:hypothetical protein
MRGHAWLAEEAKLEKEKVYEVRNKELASQMEVLMTQKLENERCVVPSRSSIPTAPIARHLVSIRKLRTHSFVTQARGGPRYDELLNANAGPCAWVLAQAQAGGSGDPGKAEEGA